MANFRVIPGMWIKIVKPHKALEVGQEFQILLDRWGYVAFIGHKGVYSLKELAGVMEPIK